MQKNAYKREVTELNYFEMRCKWFSLQFLLGRQPEMWKLSTWVPFFRIGRSKSASFKRTHSPSTDNNQCNYYNRFRDEFFVALPKIKKKKFKLIWLTSLCYLDEIPIVNDIKAWTRSTQSEYQIPNQILCQIAQEFELEYQQSKMSYPK